MDAIAPGARAHIHNWISSPARGGIKNAILVRNPDRHRVHQNIFIIASMKIGFTTNRWHAHAIAITTNTRNHAAHQMLGFGMINRPKTQSVQIGDRARAHCEDVTHDPANTGCRALIGLNKAGMVMAFHFENCRKRFFPLARTNIDNACIFAGPANHPRGRCGEFFQMAARRFVRAML